MKPRLLFPLVLSSILLMSCPNPTIPVSTIEWEETSDGYLRFCTNDSAYCGYTFWCWDNTVYTPMTYFEGETVKTSGSASYGYGFLFCRQDSNNFYYVLISVNGGYYIGKRVGGSWSMIVDWSHPGYLNQGFGRSNTIRVTKTGDNSFSLSINGHQVRVFSDTSFDGGQYGFYASVGDAGAENFPATSMDVKFRLTYPEAVPEATP